MLSLVRNGAFTAAVTVAVDFARRNPQSAEAYALVAHAEEIAGYTKAAIQSVSQAIALAPQAPAYRLQRGRLYLKARQMPAALADIDCVIEMGQDLSDTQYFDAAVALRNEAIGRSRRHTPPAHAAGRTTGRLAVRAPVP